MNEDVYNIATKLQPNCNEPLTIEQLRGMDGKPVWLNVADGVWGIVCVSDGCVVVRPSQEIDLAVLDGPAYRYPPVATDTNVGSKLDDWTTHWVKKERHAGGFRKETGRIVLAPGLLSEEKATVLVDGRYTYKGLYCAKCGAAAADTFLDICPRCGRAATTEGLDMLEKRLRGCNNDR